KWGQRRGRGGRHEDGEVPRVLQLAGPGKVEPQRRIAGRGGGQNEAVIKVPAGGELRRAARGRGKQRAAAGRQAQVIISGRAFEVVDRDPDPRGIAGGEKAW